MEINIKSKKKIITIKKKKSLCPTCKKESFEPFTPFCSKKCSDLDLMKWFSNENCINLDSK